MNSTFINELQCQVTRIENMDSVRKGKEIAGKLEEGENEIGDPNLLQPNLE